MAIGDSTSPSSQIQHLTKLDFDLSGIRESLEQVQLLLAQSVLEIQTQDKYKIKLGVDLDGTITDANKKINDLAQSQKQLSQVDPFTASQLNSIDNYGDKIKKLNTTVKTADTGTQGYLKTLTDKARWLSAFYLITAIEEAFRQTITTVKETEDAVVELQRVLLQDIGDIAVQEQLYGIAENYGRTFADVSDTAVKFAQTGATWNETLALTEATMLAVNTAELEVETATTGLIAVISQFNLEAEDMIDVVDQINKTSDNFAVTSEKTVAALQRMGSAAVNANLSLEDSIALITSMSEATGRSGESLGTAINSLLVYSQRSTSLDIFRNLSPQMEQVVSDFEKGAASIIDVWGSLSTTLEALNEEAVMALNQELQSDAMYQQFATSLESEAVELTDSIKQTYATAGTHRQNYFIALLSNMDTYFEAMENMSDAEGYSLSENEKYMDTLTAQYNQLIANVKELAVEFGNAGFLDFMKYTIELTNNSVELVRALGGIRTVLLALSATLLAIKGQKVADILMSAGSLIPTITSGLKSLALNAQLAFNHISVGSTKASADMLKMSGASIPKLMGSLTSLATLGIGAVVTAISYWIQKQEEARQKSIESISSFNTQVESLQSLKEEYIAIADSIGTESEKNEELISWKEKLNEEYKIEKDRLDEVNGARQEGIDLINEEIQQDYAQYWAENRAEIEKARKAIEDLNDLPQRAYISQEQFDLDTVNKVMEEFDLLMNKDVNPTQGTVNLGFSVQAENDLEAYEKLGEVIFEISNQAGEMDKTTANILKSLQAYYDDLRKTVEKQGQLVKDDNEAQMAYYKNILNLQEDEIVAMTNVTAKQELYSATIQKITDSNTLSAMATQELVKWVNELFDATSQGEVENSFVALSYDAEAAKEQIESLSSAIDNAQSSFSTIISAIEQYNSTGLLSIDMVQQLMSLSGEYAASLTFQDGQLKMIDSTTGRIIDGKQELIKQYIAEQTAAQIATLAESIHAEQLLRLEGSQYDTTGSTDVLSGSLVNLAYQAITSTGYIQNLDTAIKQLGNAQGFDAQSLQQFETGVNQILENSRNIYSQIGEIANDPVVWGSDGANAAAEAAQANNDAQIEALESQKEAVQDRYNAEIEALRKVQEENERLRAKEDYERNLASAQARSGVEYREEEATLTRDWEDQLEDWNIEDRIAELERLRDAEVAVIEAQIDSLRSASEAISASAIQTGTSVQSAMISKAYDTMNEESDKLAYKGGEAWYNEVIKPMQDEAVNASKITFDAYDHFFIQPMEKAMSELFAKGLLSEGMGPLSLPTISNPSSFGSQTTNNSTNSANIFIEYNGAQSSQNINRTIDDLFKN